MTTRLDAPLRRELSIAGDPYTLTLSPTGFTLALKGRRKGVSLEWEALINGDAAMAIALNASLRAAPPMAEAKAPLEKPERKPPK